MLELGAFIVMCIVIGVLAIKTRRLASERRGTGRLKESGSTIMYMLDRGGVYGPRYPEEGKSVRLRRKKQEKDSAEGVR